MDDYGTHNNHANWSEQQLCVNAPRRLAGTYLVRVAKYRTNEELLKQANKYSTNTIKRSNSIHFVTAACLDYALDNNQEPDHFREAFDAERLRNLEARSNPPRRSIAYLRKHKCVMPANIFILSANPDLSELERARTAYSKHMAAGYMYPTDYWIKMEGAIRGLRPKQYGLMGFTTSNSASNHVSRARAIGPRLAQIVQNNANAVQAGPSTMSNGGAQAAPIPHPTTGINPNVTLQASTAVQISATRHTTTARHTTTPLYTPSPHHSPIPLSHANVNVNVKFEPHQLPFYTTLCCFIRSIERRPDILNLTTLDDLVSDRNTPDSGETDLTINAYNRCIRNLDRSAYDDEQVAEYVSWIMSEWLGKRLGDDMTILETMVLAMDAIDVGMDEMIKEKNRYNCRRYP